MSKAKDALKLMVGRVAELARPDLGREIDDARNESPERGIRVISTDASRVTVLVIPTNEELEIARQTVEAVA